MPLRHNGPRSGCRNGGDECGCWRSHADNDKWGCCRNCSDHADHCSDHADHADHCAKPPDGSRADYTDHDSDTGNSERWASGRSPSDRYPVRGFDVLRHCA
jgi:hypothetical protein